MIVHGIPELWTTRERRYAGHKSWESTIRAEKDVLRWPWVVTPHKAGCLGRNVCCLKQPSTASRVRVSKVRWCRRVGRCWRRSSRMHRKLCRSRRSQTPCLCQRPALALGQRVRVAVLGVWREAPDAGASWGRGGGLVGWGSSLFCGCRVCAAFRWMVWGSGCAGVAVPSVTSMQTLKGRIMSIPIKQGGDSSPTMTIKLALPLASPHWISRCSVLPAIWSGFPCALWKVFSNGSSAPHWAR